MYNVFFLAECRAAVGQHRGRFDHIVVSENISSYHRDTILSTLLNHTRTPLLTLCVFHGKSSLLKIETLLIFRSIFKAALYIILPRSPFFFHFVVQNVVGYKNKIKSG